VHSHAPLFFLAPHIFKTHPLITNDMRLIPSEHTKHGFALKLLVRNGKAAIYEQWKHGRLCAYEVVKIRTRKAREAMGVIFPAAEYLPSDEDWGSHGKTCSGPCVAARNRAQAQFEAVLATGHFLPYGQ
jgi:hypothetical protein